MSFFVTCAIMTLRRLLRRPAAFGIAAMLLPACLFAAGFFKSEAEILTIRAGILLSRGDAFAEAVYARLENKNSGVAFEAFDISERNIIETEIIKGEIECAFVLTPGLSERIVRGRGRDEIELLISERSVAAPLAGEMLLSAILAEKKADMTAELFEDVLGYSHEDAAKIAREKIKAYEDSDIFLKPEYIYIKEGGETSSPQAAGERLLHGIIAIFLLGGTVWTLPAFLAETKNITKALSKSKKKLYRLSLAAGISLAQLLTGTAALILIAAIYPAALGSFPEEAVSLIFYCAALGFGGAALLATVKSADAIYSGGALYILLSASIGGVFLDIKELGGFFGALGRFFPTAGYISGAMGQAGPGDALAAAILMGAGVAFIVSDSSGSKIIHVYCFSG